jgi:WD40 repeat protein
MTDPRANIPSIVDRTRPVAAGPPVVAVRFLGTTAVFVLGEEALLWVAKDGTQRRTQVHAGAILAAAADSGRLVSGGDDGKVVTSDAEGESAVLATDPKQRWIDHVAAGPNGAVAWSAGKQAFARTGKGSEHMLDAPSTVGGLAFAPKGFRLAVAHYNGATLWYPNARQAAPEKLEWRGSHLAASFSPDGRFLVTSMQEPTLHGWRLADRKDMRMSGYGARVRSLAWTVGGKWLATSGSTQLILWPFQGNDGPMGKTPRLLAPREAQVEVVACHPKQEVAAVGYADGLVLIVRLEDGAEILARKPASAPVSALAWSADGKMLGFGTDDGEAGIVEL